MKRVIAILTAVLLLAAGITVSAIAWLGFTESGLQFIVTRAREHLPAGIHIGPVHGQLLGTLRLNDISYRDPSSLNVNIAHVELRWSPAALLRNVVRISELIVQGVNISLPASESNEPPPPGFRFPVAIVIRSGLVSGIEIQEDGDDAAWKLSKIAFSARARDDRLKIKKLGVEAGKFSTTASGFVGTMQPFPVALSLDARWSGLAAPFETHAEFSGDFNALRVQATTPAPYTAKLDGHIRDLLTVPGWDATLTLDRAAVVPFIPGARMRDLSGSFKVAGNVSASTINASLRAATATEPSLPVLLDSHFVADAGGFDIQAFDLRSSVNGLHARGSVRDKIDLKFQLAADDLGALLPGFTGKVTGRGALQGTRERPRATVRLAGSALSFGDFQAGALNINLSATDWKRFAGHLDMTAKKTGTQNFLFDALTLRASGSDAGHTARLTAQRERDTFDATVNARLHNDTLDGQLRRAAMRVAGMDWSLENPAPFRYATGAFTIAETCLGHADAAVCANFDRARDGSMSAKARTRNVKLALLDDWLPDDIAITGTFAAALDARINRDGEVTGNLDANIGAGEIRYGGRDSDNRIPHEGGALTAHAQGGRLNATLRLHPAPASRVEGDWQLPFDPLRKPAGDAQLSGTLHAVLTDPGLLTSFIPDVASPKGRLTADLQFAGTTAKPQITGSAKLEDGAVGIPRLGIRLDPVRAQVSGNEDGSLHMTMEAHSGGKLELDGNIRVLGKDGLNAQLDVSGKNFSAARLPNLDLTLDPALHFDIRPRFLKINGEIVVPRGRITARKLEGTQTPSSDVVIVGRKTAPERASTMAVDANVRVRLGDDVRIDVVGVSGRIDGALAITQKPESEATGVGELEIHNGRYEGYSRRLEIKRGRLVFAGGAVTDPRFDVRAVRTIQDIEAGVDLTGTVSRPQVTLYSDPAMNDTDILSYMMFGRPASTATQSEGSALAGAAASIGLSGGELLAKMIGTRFGIEDVRVENTGSTETTSLVLGTYLTPKMYLQYGVGLFDPINTLTIRYDLSKRWRVEAESGESQGGDLLFSIDR